jgi:hypothetical protein
VQRAVELGLPIFLGILGGTPEHWAQYGHAHRNAWDGSGHAAEGANIAVAVHGFVGDDDRQSKAMYLEHEIRMFHVGSAEIGQTFEKYLMTLRSFICMKVAIAPSNLAQQERAHDLELD